MTTPERILYGGRWVPIDDVEEESVVRAAKLALEEYNKQNVNQTLSFVSIIEGQVECVAGLNYDMVISAVKDSGAASVPPTKYKAVFRYVWWMNHSCELTSLTEIQD
ncbi:hypothetical protein C2S51_026672 [Perilla frutescens var. frutescens]|nr:hypothetical protein C2S51_026672 [Perilla frutescens var. frutescens]